MGQLIRVSLSAVMTLALGVPFLVIASVAAVTAAATDAGPVTLGSGVPEEYRADVLAASERCPRISPVVLAAQLAVESDWNPRAVSPAGAQGLAQFMPATWRTWGGDLDEDGTASPFDPGDAIRAQADYLCHVLDIVLDHHLGDGDSVTIVSLALAAYNAGPGAVLHYGGTPPYAETTTYVDRIRALATSTEYALRLVDEPGSGATAERPAGGVDAMLPNGYRNGRTSDQALRWALSQVGVWRDAGYCLRFVGRYAYQRPWDGASINRAHQVWDNAPASLRRPRDFSPPRGAIVLWSAAIGGGAGHIAISLGDGRMVTTTRGAVAVTGLRGFADHAYLGWMPPDFRSQ
ncbi:MAG: lytic transglycosylase domain-containing protein [Propionicimonas sp.]